MQSRPSVRDCQRYSALGLSLLLWAQGLFLSGSTPPASPALIASPSSFAAALDQDLSKPADTAFDALFPLTGLDAHVHSCSTTPLFICFLRPILVTLRSFAPLSTEHSDDRQNSTNRFLTRSKAPQQCLQSSCPTFPCCPIDRLRSPESTKPKKPSATFQTSCPAPRSRLALGHGQG